MIPFSLMWGGFSFFWEYEAVKSGGPLFFDLWGVPFLLVGLYMIVGRFFYEAMLRSRTYYGLTNQRVIIISGLLSQTVKSLQVKPLPTWHCRRKRRGSAPSHSVPTCLLQAEGRARAGSRNRPSTRSLMHGKCLNRSAWPAVVIES